MDYELLKKLQAAGYPVKENVISMNELGIKEYGLQSPTTDELLDALGEEWLTYDGESGVTYKVKDCKIHD